MLDTMNEHAMTNGHQSMPQSDMERCIENCLSCHRICLSAMTNHCLAVGGPHVAPEHLKLMMDCVQICQTSADFMTRSSTFHTAICDTCATICEACAQSCLEVGDMDDCVEACRRCAESCRQMAGNTNVSIQDRNAFVI